MNSLAPFASAACGSFSGYWQIGRVDRREPFIARYNTIRTAGVRRTLIILFSGPFFCLFPGPSLSIGQNWVLQCGRAERDQSSPSPELPDWVRHSKPLLEPDSNTSRPACLD